MATKGGAMAIPSNGNILVVWTTRDKSLIRRIRERFSLPAYTTLNGITPAKIKPEDMPLLEETARRGFIQIWRRKWCKNGGSISF